MWNYTQFGHPDEQHLLFLYINVRFKYLILNEAFSEKTVGKQMSIGITLATMKSGGERNGRLTMDLPMFVEADKGEKWEGWIRVAAATKG